MLMLNGGNQSGEGVYSLYLNTSHVNVKFFYSSSYNASATDLNTSHVNVKCKYKKHFQVWLVDLNTSHVNVK